MKYIIACMIAFAVGATAFAQDNNNNNNSSSDQSQSMPNGANDDPGDNYVRNNPGSFGDTVSQEPNVNEYDDYSGKASAVGSQNQNSQNSGSQQNSGMNNNSGTNNENSPADTSNASASLKGAKKHNDTMNGASVKKNASNEDKTMTTTTKKERVDKNGGKTTTTKTVTKTIKDKSNNQSSGEKKHKYEF